MIIRVSFIRSIWIDALILVNDPLHSCICTTAEQMFSVWPLGGARYSKLTAVAEDYSPVVSVSSL